MENHIRLEPVGSHETDPFKKQDFECTCGAGFVPSYMHEKWCPCYYLVHLINRRLEMGLFKALTQDRREQEIKEDIKRRMKDYVEREEGTYEERGQHKPRRPGEIKRSLVRD